MPLLEPAQATDGYYKFSAASDFSVIFIAWTILKTKQKQKLCTNHSIDIFPGIALIVAKKSSNLIPGIFLHYLIQDACMTVIMTLRVMAVTEMNFIWQISQKHWIALEGSSRSILNTTKAKRIIDWLGAMVDRTGKKHLSITFNISIQTLRIMVRFASSVIYTTIQTESKRPLSILQSASNTAKKIIVPFGVWPKFMRNKETSKARSNVLKNALRYIRNLVSCTPILDVFTIKWGIRRKQ